MDVCQWGHLVTTARGRTSAGLLPVRVGEAGAIEVLIAHMGGPLWARKDDRAWSIVKGEYDLGTEEPQAAAAREWREETGSAPPAGEWFDIGTVRQSGGKVVQAYVVLVAGDIDVDLSAGARVMMEWPPRSGRQVTFPEIDRVEWCGLDVARRRLVAAQSGFLDRLGELA